MDYVVSLRNDLPVYDLQQAQKKYLELQRMGYDDSQIIFTALTPVQLDFRLSACAFASPWENNYQPHQMVTENPT